MGISNVLAVQEKKQVGSLRKTFLFHGLFIASTIALLVLTFHVLKSINVSFWSRVTSREVEFAIDIAFDDAPPSDGLNETEMFIARGEYSRRIYALGDLFNMPSFHQLDWNKTTMCTESYLLENFVGQSKALTLFDAYFHNYSDFDNSRLLNYVHRFPNVTHLRRAVNFYGERAKNRTGEGRNRLVQHIDSVAENTTLLIHFRGGDKGLDDFEGLRESIEYVMSRNNFTNVVVMSGVHIQTFYQPLNESFAITHQGVEWIVGNVTARGVNCTVHFGSNPDDDVYLISQASNFLAHRGGFSAIGALVCSGNVFFARTFADEFCRNPEYLDWIYHPYFTVNRLRRRRW